MTPSRKWYKVAVRQTISKDTWRQKKSLMRPALVCARSAATWKFQAGRCYRERSERDCHGTATMPKPSPSASRQQRLLRHWKPPARPCNNAEIATSSVSERVIDHLEKMDGPEILDSVDEIEKLGISDADAPSDVLVFWTLTSAIELSAPTGRSMQSVAIRSMQSQAPLTVLCSAFHPLDPFAPRARLIVHGRFLRLDNFLLQNCAIYRNAARIRSLGDCSEKQTAQRCENGRTNAFFELQISCSTN